MNINQSKTQMRFYTIAEVAEFMSNHEQTLHQPPLRLCRCGKGEQAAPGEG
jgi:hypothetical protein